ncbi:NAD-binding Rossmann fold oxidoreductase [Vararia minispora EC-137]|uniref:NAD-binding Rossmann fold oxidoreductase n=1 Tax=Vararia minispora EC-137 TaxID=1314806 RepID=A0ACB8Q9W0_9AGAM|nr:NAD-binding Rossmann fold oxidoreductase [Vararia minispora EC-137]
MPIRLGVVGLSTSRGWAASNLIPPIFAPPLSEHFVLTALSTSSPASAAASAAHFSELAKREVKGYHGSTEAICADPDVDAVVVSVRVSEHFGAVMPAIEAGKDVFVEWPLGKNLAEARTIAQAARGRGLRTMIGLQGWQGPSFVKIKEWVDTGKIGRVISTSWLALKIPEIGRNAPFIGLDTHYEYYRNPSNGGTYLDIFIGHPLSYITFVLGKLRKVNATITTGFPEVRIAESFDAADGEVIPNDQPDQWAISGVFDCGALFSASWLSLGAPLAPGQPALVWEIVGTEGKIRVESDQPYTAYGPGVFPPDTVLLNGERVSFVEENSEQTTTGRAWEAFASGVEGSYPTFEDAVDVHRLIDAIKKSDTEGRTVSFDEI